MAVKLTDNMRAALIAAGTRWDHSLTNIDMRVVRGLIRRGLVDVTAGTQSYYRGNGEWHTRCGISDVKINDAGRRAVGV